MTKGTQAPPWDRGAPPTQPPQNAGNPPLQNPPQQDQAMPPTPQMAPAQKPPSAFSKKVRDALGYAIYAAVILFITSGTVGIWLLGDQYHQPWPFRVCVSLGMLLGILAHGQGATGTSSASSRLFHGIALIAWMIIGLFLSALYMFIASKELATVLPTEMIAMGRYIYVLVAPIGLLLSVVSLVVPAVSLSPIKDSLGITLSRYADTVIIFLVVITSAIHVLYFGLRVAKTDVFSSWATTVIAELTFVMAEKKVLHEIKARAKTGQYDVFDLIVWAIFGIAVLGYLITINMYSVRFAAGTIAPGEELSAIIDSYSTAPLMILGASAILHIVTALVDRQNPRGGATFFVMLAEWIIGVRKGVALVRSVVNQPIQLPQPNNALQLSQPNTMPQLNRPPLETPSPKAGPSQGQNP